MNNSKPTSIIALVSIAVIVFALQNQPASSKPKLPKQSQAFGHHYDEERTHLPGAVIDEDGAHPGTGSLQMPVLDRTVRISVTFRAQNGEVAFGEVTAYYRSSTGECAFQAGAIQNGYNFPLFAFDVSAPGITMTAGPDGTLALENFITSPGDLHVAFWY